MLNERKLVSPSFWTSMAETSYRVRWELSAAFVTAILSYSYFVFSGAIEFEGLGSIASRIEDARDNYFAPARYVFFFISKYIGSASFTPFLSMLVFSSLLAASSVLVLRTFHNCPQRSIFFGAMVFVSIPLFSAKINLWLWTDAFAVSYFTAALAAYLLVKRRLMVFPSLLMIATLLNYQPSMGIFLATICLYVVSLVLHLPSQKAIEQAVPVLVRTAIVTAISLVTFLIALRASRPFSTHYTDRITEFNFTPSAVFYNTAEIFRHVFLIPYSDGFHALYPGVISIVVLIFMINTVMMVLKHNAGPAHRIAALVLVAFFIAAAIISVSPFNAVLSEPVWWARTQISVAVLIAFFTAYSLASSFQWLRITSVICAIFTIFSFIQAHNVAAFSQRVMNDYDRAVTNRIINYVSASPEFDPRTEYLIVGVNPGWHMYTAASGSLWYRPATFASFAGEFNWWTRNLFTINGLHNIEAASDPAAVRERFAAEIEELGIWPRPDSVRILENRYVLVRFR